MLFPSEYGKLDHFNMPVKNEFVALHFHKDKARMPYFVQKFKLLE
jgi:hypothetical protein